MDSFFICLNAILPIVLIAAVGYAAKRFGVIREKDVPRMNAVVFKVFMPVMSFYNIYVSDLSSALRPELLLFIVAGIMITYGLSFVYARFFVPVYDRRGVVIQGLFRSNYLIIGLPMAAGLTQGGDIGVAAVAGAVVVPVFNALAVITLEAYNGQRPKPMRLLLDVMKNPLIIGSLLGIAALLIKLRLPTALEATLRDMSRAASPMMLFLLGAFFRFSGVKGHGRELTAVCLGRLVLIPAMALAVAIPLGFRGVELITVLAVFASSTAVSSFTMAEQLGGDAALAGDIVVMTSALASLSLFAWSYLLKVLNLF